LLLLFGHDKNFALRNKAYWGCFNFHIREEFVAI
jgi:hypothetical protein